MGCGSSPDSPTPCSLFPSQEGCLSPPHTAFPSAAGIPALSLREHVRVCELSHFSCVQLFVTLWTTACQAPLSVGFSRQEYWCGLPCPAPGDLPDLGIKPAPFMSPALAGVFFTTNFTWEVPACGPLSFFLGLYSRCICREMKA